MQLHDYIKVIPNILDYRFCSDILNNKKYKYKSAQIIDDHAVKFTDTTVRNCLRTTLVGEDDKIVYQAVGTTINKYIEELQPTRRDNLFSDEIKDSGYDLLKYEKGGLAEDLLGC